MLFNKEFLDSTLQNQNIKKNFKKHLIKNSCVSNYKLWEELSQLIAQTKKNAPILKRMKSINKKYFKITAKHFVRYLKIINFLLFLFIFRN